MCWRPQPFASGAARDRTLAAPSVGGRQSGGGADATVAPRSPCWDAQRGSVPWRGRGAPLVEGKDVMSKDVVEIVCYEVIPCCSYLTF